MITNERQYKIARQQLARMHDSLEALAVVVAENSAASRTLRQAEASALESQIGSITAEIGDYEALRAGAVSIPADAGLAELPHLLIRARIAGGMSQGDLAKRVGLKEQQIQRYESQEYASASLSRLKQIAEALGLKVAAEMAIKPPTFDEVEKQSEALDWHQFPLKEMYKRGWFAGFTGDLSEAMKGAEVLVQEFVEHALREPIARLNRQRVRSGGEYNKYALLAWQCRVLALAQTQNPVRYRASNIDEEWFRALGKKSQASDGPVRARKHLAEAGIVLIIEPHLAGTFLDGAALLHGSRPVIGMTLRYDRLDHFWFVLFHELVHVKWHLRKGVVDEVFDDLDVEVVDEIEREADARAGELLIPASAWKRAVARYTRSRAAVEAFAGELGINPAIVAGRIRHEGKNYVILNELVGQGEARKYFPGVLFGT
jgi:HTH-type transcriptional regulator / antitoxin HigA